MPAIATLACVVFIVAALRAERQRPDVEPISWMPFCWMFIAGSRFVSSWLNLRAPLGTVEAYAEGSPVDRLVFIALIVWGAAVLSRRRIAWGQLLTANALIVIYFLFCLLSLIWSDQPDVLVKRWVKDLGNPITALVLLTERKPLAALTTTVRRLGFILLPLSVLFIRYYPELGRGYAAGGAPMYSGVADQKNTLGLLCLTVGVCGLWRWLIVRVPVDRYEWGCGAMLVWLLYMANSKTSLTCFLVGVAILATAKTGWVQRRPVRLMTVTTCAVAAYIVADSLFAVQEVLLTLLRRDPTLTNRTEVWAVVSALQTHPYVGAGFMSFWSGERMATIWTQLGPGINQAHNGYLEQYLNLGYIGVAFIVAIMSTRLWRLRSLLTTKYGGGVLSLVLVLMASLYNYTEASFYGINLMWVLLLTATFDAGAGIAPQPAAVLSTVRRRALQHGYGFRTRMALEHRTPRAALRRTAPQP